MISSISVLHLTDALEFYNRHFEHKHTLEGMTKRYLRPWRKPVNLGCHSPEGQLVGLVESEMSGTDPDTRMLITVLVDPAYRGKAIGSALVSLLPADRLLVHVRSLETEGFYRKLGFGPAKLVEPYPTSKAPRWGMVRNPAY